MPTPTERQSLEPTNNLASRYESQQCGGAYNAKTIGKWGTHAPMENTLQSRFWTPAGFKVGMKNSEFTNTDGSEYLIGHTTKKYWPR